MNKCHSISTMNRAQRFITLTALFTLITSSQDVSAQSQLAQDAHAIFEANCLNCHGTDGAFRETLLIEYGELIDGGTVVPGDPDASELYKRLIGPTENGARMPFGQPQLPAQSIDTIQRWILAGAPDWTASLTTDRRFIPPGDMLKSIESHLNSLSSFDRPFARYFTMTHLYNAGEPTEILREYRKALSKLVNSLSWRLKITNPQPIDPRETIFYIDLRHYEWDRIDGWTKIVDAYPYHITFDAPEHLANRNQLARLQTATKTNVPSVHIDWFIARASTPPQYDDLLSLPSSVQELEARLEVDVARNLRDAPGIEVWRAGFNDSGVSNHNRVVERHTSRYGAYWKSYDFAGSVATQNILTHPLNFTHDGGEVIFNLPNGLQGYYLVDGNGLRLDEAPISIVSNPAASDPTVRNGISCIGCHTEGMKTFEDEVRSAIEGNPNPPYNKEHALRLYVEKPVMDALVAEDMQTYRVALEATGVTFGGVEPVSRFHEAFHVPIDAAYAAAVVGLRTETFLERVRENTGLQNVGLLALDNPNGSVKRDTWKSSFRDIISALDYPDLVGEPPVITQPDVLPGGQVDIPDPNLRAVIEETLETQTIRPDVMATLTTLKASDRNISDLTRLEFAVNLEELWISENPVSDLSPLAGCTNLVHLFSWHTQISDVSPLRRLTGLTRLELHYNRISDISPLAALTDLTRLNLRNNEISDISPLAGLTSLTWLAIYNNEISDFSALEGLKDLRNLQPGFNAGAKIEGPWLWVFLPTTRHKLNENADVLAEASGGEVTEQIIGTAGATEGNAVGEAVWTRDRLPPSGRNNLVDMVGRRLPDGVMYGVISLTSPIKQDTILHLGSDQEVKVWLNGKVLYQRPRSGHAEDFIEAFPITLQQGTSVLLVAVGTRPDDATNLFIGLDADTKYALGTYIKYVFSESSIHTGDTFTVDVRAHNIIDLAGWQFDIAFDTAVLEAIDVMEGDFLKTDGATTFFQSGRIDNSEGKISGLIAGRISERGASGSGSLLQVEFKALSEGESELALEDFEFGSITGENIPAGPLEISITVEERLVTGDVNRDGRVSILGLILVARQLGSRAPPNSAVDINRDEIVNIFDLTLVAQGIVGTAAPPVATIKRVVTSAIGI